MQRIVTGQTGWAAALVKAAPHAKAMPTNSLCIWCCKLMSQQPACCAATSATPSRICGSQPVWGHRTDTDGLRGYWACPLQVHPLAPLPRTTACAMAWHPGGAEYLAHWPPAMQLTWVRWRPTVASLEYTGSILQLWACLQGRPLLIACMLHSGICQGAGSQGGPHLSHCQGLLASLVWTAKHSTAEHTRCLWHAHLQLSGSQVDGKRCLPLCPCTSL